MRIAAAALLVVASACVPEHGPLMSAGEDCLECHRGGGEARTWTAAGTWEGEGHRVSIRDANGKSFTLRTNQAGNFYTAEPLVYPLLVSVDGEEMPYPVPTRDCVEDRCCTGERCGCADCHGRGEGDDDQDDDHDEH